MAEADKPLQKDNTQREKTPFPTDEELLAMLPDILRRAQVVRILNKELEESQRVTGETLRKEFVI